MFVSFCYCDKGIRIEVYDKELYFKLFEGFIRELEFVRNLMFSDPCRCFYMRNGHSAQVI